MIRPSLRFVLAFGLFLLACNLFSLPASSPTPDLLATLQAIPPASPIPATPARRPTSTPLSVDLPTPSPTATSGNGPQGHIVFTCQLFRTQASEQICLINADGSGWRRLTTEDNLRHFYPSLAPDGRSVVYSAFRQENVVEIYEMDLTTGQVTQLTNRLGVLTAPEISPDGSRIAFTRWTPNSDRYMIWTMGRHGENAANIPHAEGWDPTWAPDGQRILFASQRDGPIQLYVINLNGKGLRKMTSLPALRGRSDWSPDGRWIVTYSGLAWQREIYLLDAKSLNARIISPPGGNSQGPAFSPDGQWVVFTAYFDHPNDEHGCEIYIMRLDGSDLRRLTDNDYCDYQPRWGP
ncbi:MAG: TolB family protein [Anaerolineae bacterium]